MDHIFWCPQVRGFVFYALMLTNGNIYKGYTSEFKNRMIAHFNGRGCRTTRISKPLYVFHHEVFATKQEALARERYFKTIGGYELRNGTVILNGFKP